MGGFKKMTYMTELDAFKKKLVKEIQEQVKAEQATATTVKGIKVEPSVTRYVFAAPALDWVLSELLDSE